MKYLTLVLNCTVAWADKDGIWGEKLVLGEDYCETHVWRRRADFYKSC